MARLKIDYINSVVPVLFAKYNYKNIMQVPKIIKIVINMGIGDAIQNSKILDVAFQELAMITGQKPIITKAKKSIATFKLRKGSPIGCKVTLRRHKMYEFFDRLVNIAIPRIRDFRGVSYKSFDKKGNFSLGIKEQFIFPEIDYEKITRLTGMNINIVTSAKTDEEAKILLKLMGMPFKN